MVFVLIAVRQVGRLKFRIWQVMLFGALVVLITGQINLFDAIKSINPDVILFLFGMFVVGEALCRSGYLLHVSSCLFGTARNPRMLIIAILFSIGILSAFLMNDTLAIIGTPLVLTLASRHRLSPKLLLLTLCFAVTTGSVVSPIGNPQNLLVAEYSGLGNPFISFFIYLAVPTLISLVLVYLILKLFYPAEFQVRDLSLAIEPVGDISLALLSKVSLLLIFFMVSLKIAGSFIPCVPNFSLTVIALVAAAPVILFSRRRMEVIRYIDWPTLVFFAAMFVLMASVFSTGFFQSFVDLPTISSVPAVLLSSVVISQFISNVPFVALFEPLLIHQGTNLASILALAVGSTIAGNLTILGAASNVIVIQNAEKQGETLTFWEFFRVGAPLTMMQIVTYSVFLSLIR